MSRASWTARLFDLHISRNQLLMSFGINREIHTMGIPLNLASIDQLVSQAWEYFSLNVLSWAMAAQIVVVGLVLFLTKRAIRVADVFYINLNCP